MGSSKHHFKTTSTVSGFGVRFLNGLYNGLYHGLYGLCDGLCVSIIMGRDVGAASAVAWLRNMGQSSSDWLRFNMSVVSSLLDSLLIVTHAAKPCSDWLWINTHAVKSRFDFFSINATAENAPRNQC